MDTIMTIKRGGWHRLMLFGGLLLSSGLALAQPLPADQAFHLSVPAEQADSVRFHWDIADGYYLYRKKFRFVAKNGAAELGAAVFPAGEQKNDPTFGAVEIYRRQVEIALPFRPDVADASVEVTYQGCSDEGVCYPPQRKTLTLGRPMATAAAVSMPAPYVSEQDQIAAALQSGSLGWTLLSFLGFGLLLAFTPCMFPMIPILSGLIAGQGQAISTARAFFLSLSYVLAASATYTVLGVLAGLFGNNLQAALQTPWVLVGFSGVFVALAGSMFGFYELQMPSALQNRLYAWSGQRQGGQWLGVAVMGALSALIMGPCVAAPLAGALIYIGQTGDAWLGGAALFSLGIGMGLPLLAIGTSAGKLLPKAGVWMESVKSLFGVMMLGLAIHLLERILPENIGLLLWAVLLILSSIYLGALDSLTPAATGWNRLKKGTGIIVLLYGALLFSKAAGDMSGPMGGLIQQASAGESSHKAPLFQKVASVAELGQRIEQASREGRWVMLDFYADWCSSCKEMERHTFSDPAVRRALQNAVLIQADVTANSTGDQAILKRFGLIGPPATLFFGPEGTEHQAFRLVGYVSAERFLQHLVRAFAETPASALNQVRAVNS